MADAIQVRKLGKRYRLGTDRAGYHTLREALRDAIRRGREPSPEQDFWALRDVSFSVGEGEAVGIIGANGAGKTTLLKIISRVTDPTCGEVRMRGRVGALLDVGTGLHPELTGRENVYLMGSILGLRRSEVRDRFDEIASFAGVERFLDTPVKRYSTGMRLRLAFAVAAFIRPPIVIVDEVLAVGDAAFREKCLDKMAELGGRGRTVLFVSHELGAVARLCSRVIWMDRGGIRRDGPTEEVISAYLEASTGQALERRFREPEAAPVTLTDVSVKDLEGNVLATPRRDQAFVVELGFVLRERIPGLDLSIWLTDERGVRVIDEAHSDEAIGASDPPELPGRYRVSVTVPGLLASKEYVVGTWIGTDHETFTDRELLTVRIAPRLEDRRVAIDRPRLVDPPLEWQLEREPLDLGEPRK